MAQRVGVVLAGGAGKRMGRRKGDLTVGEHTLADRAAGVLWPFSGSVLISIEAGGSNPAPDYPAVEDEPPSGRGPLAGIQSAFRASGDSDLLVLACDYPRAGPELFRRMIALATPEDDLVILTDPGGRDHPLVALWTRRMAEPVDQALAVGLYQVSALLADCNLRRLGPTHYPGVDLNRALTNLNWPADLSRLKQQS